MDFANFCFPTTIVFGAGAVKRLPEELSRRGIERPLLVIDSGSKIGPNLPPYIAIATTSGTGSEVSRSTVITIQKTNRKTVVFSPHLIPTVALADPELTMDMPPHITAGTGMDAFTHNVEAYISKGYHPMCDAIAIAGARLVWENLPKVMADPRNLEARSNMMMAAMMGAVAFQKGLGA